MIGKARNKDESEKNPEKVVEMKKFRNSDI